MNRTKVQCTSLEKYIQRKRMTKKKRNFRLEKRPKGSREPSPGRSVATPWVMEPRSSRRPEGSRESNVSETDVRFSRPVRTAIIGSQEPTRRRSLRSSLGWAVRPLWGPSGDRVDGPGQFQAPAEQKGEIIEWITGQHHRAAQWEAIWRQCEQEVSGSAGTLSRDSSMRIPGN